MRVREFNAEYIGGKLPLYEVTVNAQKWRKFRRKFWFLGAEFVGGK
jgi:hypothetical protein